MVVDNDDSTAIMVTKPSSSELASVPVLLRKKHVEVRYTVDYRQLHVKTITDAFPLPLIE